MTIHEGPSDGPNPIIPISANSGVRAVEQYSKAATADPENRLLYVGTLSTAESINLMANRAAILERATETEFGPEQ